MTKLKFDKEKWLPHYRSNKSAVWIKCMLTNGKQVFCDHFSGWLKLKAECEANNLFFLKIELQYRSHAVDVFSVEDGSCEGFYLIRSLLGEMGGQTRQYYTTGVLKKDGKVEKKMWLIPELIIERNTSDDISECFEEAIIYNGKKKKNSEKQV